MNLSTLNNNHTSNQFNFEMPLKSWRRNYLLVLKIAELELKKDNPENNIIEIIKWMYEDFLFSAPALMLANYYLAPGTPRKNLLKSLRSANREKALKGIKNAAWDLALLSEWLKRVYSQSSTNTLIILCSLDKKLRELCLLMINRSAHSLNAHNLYLKYFRKFWKEETAKKILSIYCEYINSIDNPSRKLKEHNYESKIKRLTIDGEKFVLDWKK